MTHVRPGDRIAVTGATGFVGQAMVELLARSGYLVVGISESRRPPARIAGLLDAFHSVNLTAEWPGMDDCRGLVHLAGLAAVGPSFDDPQRYISVNSTMVTNIFEQALVSGWDGRAIVVSSGAVYGGLCGPHGYSEQTPTVASSPYVVSKLLVENQTEYYRLRGLDTVVARPFNHIGPGQRPGFIVPDLAAKLAGRSGDEPLPVGNLDSARDYTDVRDIVSAYLALLELPHPSHPVYNVCSGTPRTGREVLEALCSAMGKPIPPTVAQEHRAIDPSVIKGDAGRLMTETGWAPNIRFQTSIDEFIACG